MMRALFARGPDPIALALLGSLAPWAGGAAVPGRTAASISPAPIRARDVVPAPEGARAATVFALVWLAAFGLVVGPVAHRWSAYYYTLSAVGGAVIVAVLARGLTAWSWLALCAGLLWWHAGATGTRAFAVAERPWVWTSHVTSAYLERSAALTRALS